MTRKRRVAIGLAILATALGLAACSSSPGASGSGSNGHAVKGGVATFAEAPSAIPNFIFPFMGFTYFSVANSEQFQYLMYRPLYFFGTNGEPTLNTQLSLADYPPKFTNGDKTVTVTLKNYKWSDGESVTSQDVVFWMNFMKTEKLQWAGYVPGTIPDDVTSITTPNSKTIVFKLTGAVNSYWWTYNELAQITPLPMAWDVTAAGQKAGSQSCGTSSYQDVDVHETGTGTPNAAVNLVNSVAKNCGAVYDFLSTQSGFNPQSPKVSINAFGTYATNPLWQVVDGPWHLVSFSSNGYAAFKPNPKYSGPVKAQLSEFIEEPFTSDTAEFNALLGGKIDYGYLPSQDITANAKGPTTPGPNNARLSGKFNIVEGALWEVNYFPMNFNSTSDGGLAGKLMSQTYLRQAMQMLVDQPLLIKKDFKGYGYPTYGPVPVYPANPFASSFEKSNPYSYNPAKAVALLKSNGWTIHANGSDVCNDAAKCGVAKGSTLNLNLQYASGTTALDEAMAVQDSAWKAAGINITLTTATFDTVIGNGVPCSGASCTWDMENWGGGWVYSPDYYPSGEDLFETGAGSNAGSYSNAKMDSLIKATDFTNTPLTTWENYTTTQIPVIWQPVEVSTGEVAVNLKGTLPINPLGSITPEDWYFTR